MAQKPTAQPMTIAAADAKRRLSELLGRVAFGGETITITRRGKAMAKLVPVEAAKKPWSVYDIKPIDDDSFFATIDQIVADRGKPSQREIPFVGPEWDDAPRTHGRKRKRSR
jgi:prevent-host-death family protein